MHLCGLTDTVVIFTDRSKMIKTTWKIKSEDHNGPEVPSQDSRSPYFNLI